MPIPDSIRDSMQLDVSCCVLLGMPESEIVKRIADGYEVPHSVARKIVRYMTRIEHDEAIVHT